MRRIYLTIDINIQDECFQKMEGIQKLNIGDIIMSKKISYNPGELEQLRGKIIAETILDSNEDLLLGYALQQRGQLRSVIELIKKDNISISKIYYDKGKRKKSEIKKYKEQYKLHSKWMDYAPDFIEHQYE